MFFARSFFTLSTPKNAKNRRFFILSVLTYRKKDDTMKPDKVVAFPLNGETYDLGGVF